MGEVSTSRTDLYLSIDRYIHGFSEVLVCYNTEGYIKLYMGDVQIDVED